MLVAKIAARAGRRVTVIDGDLEAPGLTYKFKLGMESRCDGLVGWLRDRFLFSRPPLGVTDYVLDVEVPDAFVDDGELKLAPAGRRR